MSWFMLKDHGRYLMSVEIMLGAEFGVAFVAVVRLLRVVHPQDVDV